MTYVIVHKSLVGGMECENCKQINTQVALSTFVEFSDSDKWKMTTRTMCEECGHRANYTWLQPVWDRYPLPVRTIKPQSIIETNEMPTLRLD